MGAPGLCGLSAMVNDQLEIRGKIICKVKKYSHEIGDVLVIADVAYRGGYYPQTLLVAIELIGDNLDEMSIVDKYPFIPNLKAVKKFRELLIKVLLDKADEDKNDLSRFVRVAIWRFVEDLKRFDEFKAKKAKLKASIDKLSEGNPEDQEKLNRLYSVLGLILDSERDLIENSKGENHEQ